MCINVCKGMFLDYAVAPADADMQVGRCNDSAIAVCRDGDLLAYDNKRVIFVDSYFKETWRYADMTVPVTVDVRDGYPLYWYYRKFGVRIIHWWAAVMGCDITESNCGMFYLGDKTFLPALSAFDEGVASMVNSITFAAALWDRTSPRTRDHYTIDAIRKELDRVLKWFSANGTYYNDLGDILSVNGTLIKQALDDTISVKQMKGGGESKN
mmetsp:Transcript_42027/g.88267  ORF Transcript_42027/g.88267 Transcript_42027/m.88267 type:complete len:211 (+) Transcript_42027:492-1124(+)